jgi:CARDB protein
VKAKAKSKAAPKLEPEKKAVAPRAAVETTPKLEPKPAPKKSKPTSKPAVKPKPAPKPAPPPPAPPPDMTAPTVTITAGPAAATQADAVDIAFQADEAGVAFACRLDLADYAACSSPVHLGGLVAGPHAFSVRATDKAGNVGQPASASWTYTPPDTTPPRVTITSGPSGTTADTSASFSFSADEAGSSFQCSLDGGAFNGCDSPAVYSGLAPGFHTFSVRATDKAGNTSQPGTRSWTITAPLPDLLVSSFTRFSITVTNKGKGKAEPSVLTITNVGTFTVPGLAPGGSATFSWSTCRIAIYSAVADRTNAVAESDESNNTATLRNTCT